MGCLIRRLTVDLENRQARLDWESGPEAGRDGDVAAAG